MNLPTFLETKKQVVVFHDKETINKSDFLVKDGRIELSGSETLYLYLEDYQGSIILLNLEKATRINLYMIFKSSKSSHYDIRINLDEEAELDVFSVVRNVEKTKITINRKSVVGRLARLAIRNALTNFGATILNETIDLEGEYAKTELDQLNIGSFNDVFTINQDVSHKAKYTVSTISNSLISNSNSRLDYSVAGRILKGNEFSSCRQTNKGIILQETGEIEVIPKLFIDEYNVEASHGAAIGQIDEEQLYYLLSRGLSETEARSLIISGYTKPFVNGIADEDIKELVERQIHKTIKEVDSL